MQVDVKVITEGKGSMVYKDHLPPLGTCVASARDNYGLAKEIIRNFEHSTVHCIHTKSEEIMIYYETAQKLESS